MSEGTIGREVDFGAGTHIAEAAKQLVAVAADHGKAVGSFNDIVLTATHGTTAAEIVAYFDRETAARSEAYRKSPAGIEAAREADERRASLQATHDALMRQLPSLDFNDDVAVLDWCCAMQEPSDHVNVIVRKKTIVSTFIAHGFKPNANCGPDFDGERRENFFKWLVGQAISGLSTGPAIHPIIHKFAAKWKAKFIVSAKTTGLSS